MKKKISLAVIGFSGILTIFLFSVVFIFQTSLFQGLALKEIHKIIPGQLSWKELSFSFLSGVLDIRELRLSGKDESVPIHIPRLSIDISLQRLFKGELLISSVQADACQLDLSLNKKGQLNLLSALVDPAPDPKEKKGGAFIMPMNIRINKINIRNGAIRFIAGKEDIDSFFSGLDVSISGFDLSKASAMVEMGILKGSFRWKENVIELLSLTARADISGSALSGIRVLTALNGMELDLSGTADKVLAEPVLDLTLKTRLDLEALKKIYKTVAFPSGTAATELRLKGSPKNPEAVLSITYGPGSFQNQPIEALNLKSVLKDRVLTLLPSRLESGLGSLQLEGIVDLKEAFPEGFFPKTKDLDQIRYELILNQDLPDMSKIPLLKDDVKGRLSSKAVLKGKGVLPGKIKADVSWGLKAEQIVCHPLYPAMDILVDLKAGFEGHTADIQFLDIRSKEMNLKGKGSLVMPGFDVSAMTLSGQFHLDAKHLAWLENFIPVSAKGPVNITAAVDGDLFAPSAHIVVNGKDIEAKKNRIGDVAADLKISKGILTIERADLSNKNSRLGVQGSVVMPGPGSRKMAANPNMDLTLYGGRIFLEDFMPDMKGRISLLGKVWGDVENPSANFDMSGRDLLIHGRKIQGISAKAALREKIIEINEIRADVAKTSHVKAGGRVSLADGTLDISLKADDFDLAIIDALQKQNIQKAVLSIDATAKGRIENPVLEGRIHIKDIKVSSHEMAPLDIRFGLENKMLHIKTGTLLIKGRDFPGKTLDLEASGFVPLEIIRPFVKDMEKARGKINISASLKGKVTDPLFLLDLGFDELAFTMDRLEQDFHQISGHIRVTPEKIEIIRFSGNIDQGQVELGGSLGLSGGSLKDMDLKLNAHQLPLDIPDMMELTLDSRLTLKGTSLKSELSGEIRMLEGRYYRNVDLVSAAIKKTRKIEPLLFKKENPILDGMSLNILVTGQEPLLVDNNMAYLAVSPDLAVRGTAGTPVLAGRATVDSGTINFYKSEFDVKKGEINFINPYKTDPVIDIEGEMKLRAWTIFLMVSGPLDNLDMQLFSEPPESHADLVSLIAFGKTTKEMGKTQENGQAASGRVVSGLLAEALQKNLKAATGVDQLEIKMDEQDGSGSQAVRVTVGKDLSRQMGVIYDVDTRSGDTVQRVTTFYKLMENLLMRGFQDSGGKMGGELKYRLEFR